MTERSRITDAIREGKARISDVDSTTRQRLAARYAATWERVESELQFVGYLVEAERAGPWFTDDGRLTRYGEQAFRQQRLESLLALIEAEYGRTANVALSDLTTAQQQAIGIGTQAATSMALEGSTDAALNTGAYERIIAATEPDSPLRGVLGRYGDEARTAIEMNLIDGMIAGKGTGDIVENIHAVIGDGVPRWKLASISRTESLRAFRGSLFTAYDSMGVQEWQWTATLSQRTCKACLAMHGRRFPMSQAFMQNHPQCRCVNTPVVEGIGGMSGDEWFRRQPEDWQREQLGEAYDLYQSGVIDLGAFVQRRRSRTWGTSIFERPISDVIARAA